MRTQPIFSRVVSYKKSNETIFSLFFRKVHLKNPEIKRIEVCFFVFLLKHSFNGGATVENGMRVPQKISHRTSLCTNHSTLGVHAEGQKQHVHPC